MLLASIIKQTENRETKYFGYWLLFVQQVVHLPLLELGMKWDGHFSFEKSKIIFLGDVPA